MKYPDYGKMIGTKLAITFYFEEECKKMICDICRYGEALVEPEPRRYLLEFGVVRFTPKGWCIPKDGKEFQVFKNYLLGYEFKKCQECEVSK